MTRPKCNRPLPMLNFLLMDQTKTTQPIPRFLQTEFADDEALAAVSAPFAKALLVRKYPPTRFCRMASYLVSACSRMLSFLPTSMSTSMADLDRSPSVQSFASADSMSIPATSVPASPVASSTILHHDDMPRVITATPDSTEHEIPQTHRFYLKDGNIKFELDDGSLYNVHRYFFETHAPTFAEEYLDCEASAPVKLSGVCSVDFERFLSMIYPTALGKFDITTVDEWTSILRLATRWSVFGLRDLAIEELKPKATPFDKVVIAREFELGKDWLLPAFVDICERPQWLNRVEAERLGLSTVVEIGRIREEARTSGPTFDVLAAVRATEMLVPCGHEEAHNIDDVPQVSSTTASSTLAGAASATDALPPSDVASLVASPPASSAPQTPLETTPDALPTELLNPADQLAYDALRRAELAEEASFPSTPLNRALFASHLARRMANETSPAAQRHREWRQARVDNIIREMAGSQGSFTTPNDMSISIFDTDRLGMLHSRLAYLLCAKLATCGSIPWPHAGCGDELTVLTSTYHSMSFDLARRGWVVASFSPGTKPKSVLGKFHVAIPDWDEHIPKYMIVSSSESAHPSNYISKKPRRLSGHIFFPLNFHGQSDSLTLDDGSLYNVHRYFFETHAPSFADEYLPKGGTASIKLPGVSSVDFERFLSIVYPMKLGRCDIHTVDEWTLVLRLATKWSIESLRDLSIEEIEPKASPFDKVAIAREFDQGQNWLVPAFVDICSRSESLTRAEAERLGLPTVVEVSRIREEVKASGTALAVLAAVRANEVLIPHRLDDMQQDIHLQDPIPSGLVDADAAADASCTPRAEPSTPHVPASAPTSEACLDVSLQQSTLSQISKRLAHLTLQSAEIAEEARHTDTPLNRALFALNLVRRMSKETSVAAQRHRAWREACVDGILSELGSEGCAGGLYDLGNVRGRLSRLLCARLREGEVEVEDESSCPRHEKDFLIIRLGAAELADERQNLKSTLRIYGWKVEDVDDYDLQVSVPDKACNDEDVPKYTQ
ncbi:hypothetical protein EV715DRAFT_277638 [Schizophyllum commune]